MKRLAIMAAAIIIFTIYMMFQKKQKIGYVIDAYYEEGVCYYVLKVGNDTIDYPSQCCKYAYMDTVILTK